jgi:anti-sigma B factor antagonist
MELRKQVIMATVIESNASVNVALIELKGDIDGSSAPLVQADILSVAAPNLKMILDLSQVSYLSSAGLRMLLSVYRQMSAQDGQVILVGLIEEIQDTMSVTGFLDFFTTAETLDQAFATLSLKASAPVP